MLQGIGALIIQVNVVVALASFQIKCVLYYVSAFDEDFGPGSLEFRFDSAGEECNNVTLFDDESLEGSHSFGVFIESDNFNLGVDANRTITIRDTDSKNS